MTRIAKLFAQIQAGRSPTFDEFIAIITAVGFVHQRTRGSHRVYRHPQAARILNVQPVGKMAKAYQVREFLDIIETAGLFLDEL